MLAAAELKEEAAPVGEDLASRMAERARVNKYRKVTGQVAGGVFTRGLCVSRSQYKKMKDQAEKRASNQMDS